MGTTVNRKDLYDILRFLSKAKKGKNITDARVTFSGNSIVFEFCGITSEITGEGDNFGTVILKGANFRNLCRVLPKTNEVEIGVNDGRIYFGNLRFSLEKEYVQTTSKINLPVNASKLDILQLVYHYSIEEINASGWIPMFNKYEEEKNNMIYLAYEKLCEYGISIEDITTIVNQAIQERDTT